MAGLCLDCSACIRVCPAGAIQEPPSGRPYSINRFACRAYRQAGLVWGWGVGMKVCDEVTG
ncbi:MAG: 4Fe-4S binding protein [Deltaproteobacteria bacterium]|nr:4Fe-4S binding protein [Deltaproteobacteria bacterium]